MHAKALLTKAHMELSRVLRIQGLCCITLPLKSCLWDLTQGPNMATVAAESLRKEMGSTEKKFTS